MVFVLVDQVQQDGIGSFAEVSTLIENVSSPVRVTALLRVMCIINSGWVKMEPFSETTLIFVSCAFLNSREYVRHHEDKIPLSITYSLLIHFWTWTGKTERDNILNKFLLKMIVSWVFFRGPHPMYPPTKLTSCQIKALSTSY